MNKCKFESLIDEYLFNRLDEDQKEDFEKHYFNCSQCFEKIQERNELISVIKNKGSEIFPEFESPTEPRKAPFFDRLVALLTPKQWTVAAVSAAILLIIFIGVLPNFKTQTPQFFIDEDLVRGDLISLISPVIDVREVPSQFRWRHLEKDLEYKILLYGDELLWSETTMEDHITLPQGVREQMIRGEKYSWEVKAFSSQGALVAVSSRLQFTISSDK